MTSNKVAESLVPLTSEELEWFDKRAIELGPPTDPDPEIKVLVIWEAPVDDWINPDGKCKGGDRIAWHMIRQNRNIQSQESDVNWVGTEHNSSTAAATSFIMSNCLFSNADKCVDSITKKLFKKIELNKNLILKSRTNKQNLQTKTRNRDYIRVATENCISTLHKPFFMQNWNNNDTRKSVKLMQTSVAPTG